MILAISALPLLICNRMNSRQISKIQNLTPGRARPLALSQMAAAAALMVENIAADSMWYQHELQFINVCCLLRLSDEVCFASL